MIYLAPPTTSIVPFQYRLLKLGAIITPDSDRPNLYRLGNMQQWAADNGCFAAGERFDPDRYLHWLIGLRHLQQNCLFATAPDVVGCHVATWKRSRDWLGTLRILGFKSALVAQDGMTIYQDIAWDMFDCLFIGGTTEFKMGQHARLLIKYAAWKRKWVHVGRVNSGRRYAYFQQLGVDSVDGTCVCFGPDLGIPKVLSWIGET